MARVRPRQPVPTHLECMHSLDIGGWDQGSFPSHTVYVMGFGCVWLGRVGTLLRMCFQEPLMLPERVA